MGIRNDGREPDELRPHRFTRDYTEFAMGSVLVEIGRTRVLCTASVEERVPPWLRGTGKGWVTAEYSMLPGSTPERVDREAAKGKQSRADPGDPAPHRSVAAGRHRSRRCSARSRSRSTATSSRPTAAPAPRRSAGATSPSTTPARDSSVRARSPRIPVTDLCAAISVGVVGALPSLDLDYSEDSAAEVDMNVVMTGAGKFIEVQGTAEGEAVQPWRVGFDARAG